MRGTGTYYDGESAVRRHVTIHLDPDGLRVVAPADDRTIGHWRYVELVAVDEVARDGLCRIRAGTGHARLDLEDRTLIAEVTARAPQLATRDRGWAGFCLRWTAAFGVSMAVLLAALWLGLPRFADTAARLVPVDWEMSLGESLVEPLLRQLALIDGAPTVAYCVDPPGRDVLEALSARLAPTGSPYRFQVHVVSLEMPNAFALPGGQIVLTRGLLRFAGSPDEVAGVLAHEMGHVIHRHPTAATLEALGLGFLFGVMIGDPGIGAIGWAGETLVGLDFRREAEMEADASAVEILRRAGVSSQGLADFFERLERSSGELPAFLHLLSTHPPNESRRRRFESDATPSAPSLAQSEWRSLREICGTTRYHPGPSP